MNSLSGLVGAETLTTSSSGTFDTKNAGLNKTVTAAFTLGNGTGLASNYTLANSSLTGAITPKALTVTGSVAANKTYDGTASATVTASTLSGFIAGETLSVTSVGLFADKNAATNKNVSASYTLSNDLGLASNYTAANSSLTATISPRALAVAGITANNKVYDGTIVAFLGGFATVNALAGDGVGVTGPSSGVFTDKNVGAGKIVAVNGFVLTGADAGNYAIVQPTNVTARITAANLVITGVNANDRIYDGTTAAILGGTARISAIPGDNVSVTGPGSGVFADKNAGNAKPVFVTGFTLSGADAGNYAAVQPSGITANITMLTFDALAQFRSNLLSAPATARLETSDLFPTLVVTDGSSAEPTRNDADSTAMSSERVGTVLLHVVNGGTKLPANRVTLTH